MTIKKKREGLVQSYLQYSTNKTPNTVSRSTFGKVCRAYNKEVARLLIEEGVTYKLPYNLGELVVRRRKGKYKNLKFDFGHWKKTGETSFHINKHSNDWYAYCHWKKQHCKVKGVYVYQFKFLLRNNRWMSKIMQQQGGYQTYEIAPTPKYKKYKKSSEVNGV